MRVFIACLLAFLYLSGNAIGQGATAPCGGVTLMVEVEDHGRLSIGESKDFASFSSCKRAGLQAQSRFTGTVRFFCANKAN